MGETRRSLLYSSESSPTGALRVQRSELASVLHMSERKVRGERWKVRVGNKRPGLLLSRFGISLSKGRKHVSVKMMRMHWEREKGIV